MLLESRYDMMKETNDGMTALHIACIYGKHDIVTTFLEYLMSSGLRKKYRMKVLNAMNTQMGLSPLSIAILTGSIGIANVLITNGCKLYYDNNDLQKDLSPIFIAIELNAVFLIEMMCDKNLDLDVRNSNQQSPLLFAIYRGKVKSINYLMWR